MEGPGIVLIVTTLHITKDTSMSTLNVIMLSTLDMIAKTVEKF